MKNLVTTIFAIVFIFSFTFQVYAQSSDGSAGTTPPAGGSSSTTPPGTPSGALTPPTAPVSAPKIPKAVAPTPTPIVIDTIPDTPPTASSSANIQNVIIAALLAVAGAALLFFGLNVRKKKREEKKDDKKCANLKKLMEDKLNELTDLKSRLGSMAEGEAGKQIKNAVKDTTAENLLNIIENGKKEYERLKKLYEKCITDFSSQKTTLLYLYKPKEKQILLAMKKRSFGAGKWNGVGGKLNKGETIKDALVREAREEIGVVINQDDLVQVATLDFTFKDNIEWNQQVNVFFIEKWQREPTETEEMNPKWYSVDSLPYENMWIDDIHWLPLVLQGKKVNASFTFNKTGDRILDMQINKN